MAGIITSMLQNLLQMEFFQLLFPFMLALAIIYGVLSKVADSWLPKSARGIVSIILAFFVMLYSSMNPALYLFLTGLSGPWLMIATAVIFLIIIFTMVGIDITKIGSNDDKEKWSWKTGAFALIIVFIFVAFFAGYSGFGIGGINIMSSDLWSILFFVVILGIVMHYLTKDEPSKKS
ncbi:MAG: hypothetical protein ABIH90_02795 [Candidatus Aenigmatarchaeota archaeon]